MDASDLATCIIPLGAKLDEDEQDPALEAIYEQRRTIATADGQKHDKDNDGCLDAGTVVTCQEVRNVGNDIWMKAPSGWMAAYYDGKVYIK